MTPDHALLLAAQLREHLADPTQPLPYELAEYLGGKVKAWNEYCRTEGEISFTDWCRDVNCDVVPMVKPITKDVMEIYA